jgi:hypothetical protein
VAAADEPDALQERAFRDCDEQAADDHGDECYAA